MGKKKSTNKAVRRGVYVPPELEKRFEKHADKINFSRVACAALEREIELIESLENIKNKGQKDMIERLRKSKQEDTEAMTDLGKKEGADWATNHADYRDLLKISEFRDKIQTEPSLGSISYYCQCDLGHLTPSEAICEDIFPDQGIDAEDFFENIICVNESTRNDPYFLEGFIDGVVEVWETVKNEV